MSTEAGYQYHSISSHLFVLVNSPNFSACGKPHNITFHLIPDPHKWNNAKQSIPTRLCKRMHDPLPLRPREQLRMKNEEINKTFQHALASGCMTHRPRALED